MRRAVSPGTGRRYPLTMICAALRMPRSTMYLAMAAAPGAPVRRAKRGPKTAVSDRELIPATRAVLVATPFHGEGCRMAHECSRGEVVRAVAERVPGEHVGHGRFARRGWPFVN